MKTVIMTPDSLSPASAPEETKATKLFAQTHSTSGLWRLKGQIKDGITGIISMAFVGGPLSSLTVFATLTAPGSTTLTHVVGIIIGSIMGLGGITGTAYAISETVKLKKHQRKAIPQAITEVSSWLQENYGLKVADNIALHVAKGMSVADMNSRTWKWGFYIPETGWKFLRCTPEGLFYVEDGYNQKTLTEVSESLLETLEGIALHSTSALTDTDTQQLESIQTKANSLLISDASVETKTTVGQLTAEAVKAVELNEKLAKLNSNTTNPDLNSIFQLLNTELDQILEKEAAQVTREIETQKLYLQSRQQSKVDSKLELNSEPESITK